MKEYLKRIGPLFIIVFTILFAGTLQAAASGKIAGKIIDADTGESLIGANIVLIREWKWDKMVPMSSSIGAAADIDGNFVILNVLPGTYDVRISMMGYTSKVIEGIKVSINRTTTVDAELSSGTLTVGEVVVQATKEIIKKDMTSSIQTISAEELETYNIESIGEAVALSAGVIDGHFRGGRGGEVAYLIEGLESGIALNRDAVQEIEVISGTFNAEYGKVMSGIVNTAPKEGGERYSGMARVYASNYYTSHDYEGISASDVFHSTEARFNLSGPLFSNKLTFFVFGNAVKDDGLFYGIRRYNSTDYTFLGASIPEREWIDEHSGDNAEVPMSSSESQSFMANISWKVFTGLKVGLLYQFENSQGQTGYNHSYKYIPDRTDMRWSTNHAATLSFTNTIGTTAFHELKLLYNVSDYQSSRYKDPYDSKYVNDIYNTSNGGFTSAGNNKGFSYVNDERMEIKYDLVWQVNKNHELKFGLDYVDRTLDRNSFVLRNWYSIFDKNNEANLYEPHIPHDSTTYANSYVNNPNEFSVYLQDKSEFNDLVINFGLRYDWFNPNTIYPTDLRNPANRIVTERQSDYLDADPQSQLSPRIGLSYMMGDAAALHFSYGHFFQIPNYNNMYANPNYEISTSNYASTIGNPNIKAEKTVKYELGLQLKVTDELVFKTTLFYNDIYNLETVVPIETYDAIMYGWYTNLDYASARGLTTEFEFNMDAINFNVNYTLQYAEGNASQPNSNFTKAAVSVDPVTTFIPLDWDQRHTLNLAVGYNIDNWGVSLTSRYGSGTRYTYSPPTESSLALVKLPENGWTKPATIYADLKGFYDFNFLDAWSMDFRVGLYVYNLFDIRNEIQIYNDSGTAGSTTAIERNKDDYVSTFTDIYDYYSRPNYYSAPRSIKLELSLIF